MSIVTKRELTKARVKKRDQKPDDVEKDIARKTEVLIEVVFLLELTCGGIKFGGPKPAVPTKRRPAMVKFLHV